MRALVLGLALVSTPAMAAEQFDLICTGKDGGKGSEVARYRIDLLSEEYCFGDCNRIMKISEVTAGMITLYSDRPTVSEPATAYNTINRLTGEWRWYNYNPDYSSIMDVQGTCEKADFSGFRVSTRKF